MCESSNSQAVHMLKHKYELVLHAVKAVGDHPSSWLRGNCFQLQIQCLLLEPREGVVADDENSCR